MGITTVDICVAAAVPMVIAKWFELFHLESGVKQEKFMPLNRHYRTS